MLFIFPTISNISSDTFEYVKNYNKLNKIIQPRFATFYVLSKKKNETRNGRKTVISNTLFEFRIEDHFKLFFNSKETHSHAGRVQL